MGGVRAGPVPRVGVGAGDWFGGSAALRGGLDVVMGTANSNIGMGGPAMIEGGGLGVVDPKDIGPMHVQVPNGVVDVVIGTQPSVQGHETSFAQVLAELIAVPVQFINIIIGDTEIVSVVGGLHSRSMIRPAATVLP